MRVETAEDLKAEFKKALEVEGPCLIEFSIDPTLRPLVAQSASRM